MLKICGIAIIAAVMGYLLSELGFRGKRAFSVLCSVIFLLVFIDVAKDVIAEIGCLSLGDEGQRMFSSALKVVGIGHAFGISSEICSELSEGAIASVLTLVGKLEIVIIIIPYIRDLLEYAGEIM